MRKLFRYFAWVLATVALVIATPLQAAVDDGSGTTPPVLRAMTTSSPAVAATPPQQPDTGQGWAELYCMGCVGLGTLALYSGGITMLPVILGNASMYGTLTGTCLLACESAIRTLLR